MLHKTTAQKIAFAIHGGAGTILRQNISEQQEKEIKEDLYKALKAGYEILEKGGTALDAIEIAIRILEDSPLFNAGKGSVIAANGKIEMDASIMDGKTLRAGSVAGVRTIKNPITAARAVMEKSKHVMLTGKGAEEFAEMHGIEITDPSYFFINKRIEQLKEAKESEWRGDNNILYNDHKYGTVGAVALDKYGNLAAGTSTGGMTNKKFGRVGDSPIIGAGTYADNRSCAVSCTGHGEYFIRYTVARTVAALVEYKRWSLKKALHYVLFEELLPNGGRGGIIAVDKNGNISTQFNTEGMYRAWIDHKGNYEIKIYE
ncbi:MAG: isoaspartyl peptidase/L-asparaginase [Cytophagales bacterium]|nr:isoaspartyl peptidase/L-asparaginase [Cytophagales bacterium]MDW8383189.1 isoaspartyl peptidase/L-asparaginase [Flammeovirgaceae bacterium]